MRSRNRKLLAIIAILLAAVLAFVLMTHYIEKNSPVSMTSLQMIDTVVIDPGHGGLTNTID